MSLLDAVIAAKLNGGGGSVTVDSEFSSTSTNPVQNRVITNAMTQATAALEAKMNKPTTIVYGDGAVSFEPLDNTIYQCGELTSLTVTNPPATGSYSIVFTSGSTPTQTTIPATILGLEDFAAEANTMYEINVLDNRAVVGSWAVSA